MMRLGPPSSQPPPMVLNLRHLRVGPKILSSLQKPKYEFDLHTLWLGPTFSNAVTLDAIVASLPPNLQSLDLDLSRLFAVSEPQQQRRSCCGGGTAFRPNNKQFSKPWVCNELNVLLEGLPQSVHKLCLRFPKQRQQQEQQEDGAIYNGNGNSNTNNNSIFIPALAEALSTSRNAKIKTLDLRNSDINDDDAIAIATALSTTSSKCHQQQQNTTTTSPSSYASSSTTIQQIQHLNLSMNRIRWKGMVALIHTMNSTNIESLDLSHNIVTGINNSADVSVKTAMIKEFCDALAINQQLLELNLIGCFPPPPPPTTTTTTLAPGNAGDDEDDDCDSGSMTNTNKNEGSLPFLQSTLLKTLQYHNFTIQRIYFQSKGRPKRHDPRQFLVQQQQQQQQQQSSSSSSTNTNDKVEQQIEYWLSLNRAGRRFLKRRRRSRRLQQQLQQQTEHEQEPEHAEEEEIPIALWPHILARKSTPPASCHSRSSPYFYGRPRGSSSTSIPTKSHDNSSTGGVSSILSKQPPPDELFFLLRQNPGLLDHSLT